MLKQLIANLCREVETYQSNHFGYYDRSALVNAYVALPEQIKKALAPGSNYVKNLWRGCDGLSETKAISFTTNKGLAGAVFGVYVIPFSELKTFSGLISTEKLLKLANKLKIENGVGDDEGEVIVIKPIWKQFDIRQYRT